MPLLFLYRLAGHRRSPVTNRQLGGVLAFVAGAVNAGGFLAVQRYTSHMTGVVSAIADDLATGGFVLALGGLAALIAFVAGAACAAIAINWARTRRMAGQYALPLLLEAVLLLVFGMTGASLQSARPLVLTIAVLQLCFIMGLQNAVISKISQAEIRTTHMTGVVTDLGIELGRLLYWSKTAGATSAHVAAANRDKLAIHAIVLGLFFTGGVAGATAFKLFGFASVIPIALLLVLMASPAMAIDLRRVGRRHR